MLDIDALKLIKWVIDVKNLDTIKIEKDKSLEQSILETYKRSIIDPLDPKHYNQEQVYPDNSIKD